MDSEVVVVQEIEIEPEVLPIQPANPVTRVISVMA